LVLSFEKSSGQSGEGYPQKWVRHNLKSIYNFNTSFKRR
jgi:hypothetical protein